MRRLLCLAGLCTMPVILATPALAIDGAEGPQAMPMAANGPAVTDDSLPIGFQKLQAQYPGVMAHIADGRVTHIYGKPMTAAQFADDAATQFWAMHGDAFDRGDLELQLHFTGPASGGKFTVFGYKQTIEGLPVEYGTARLLVLNGDPARVVYASGVLARRPEGGFDPILVDSDAALRGVQSMLLYKRLETWTQPELAVFFGTGPFGEARRVWKFTGSSTDLVDPAMFTFFIDASNGRLIFARNEVLHVDVNGTVQANASPGTLPDIASNPPTLQSVVSGRAAIGGTFVYTSATGGFTIPNAGTAAVTVSTGFANGRWATVTDQSGTAVGTASTSVTPPGPANLILNPTPSEFTTAQANGFLVTTITHDFWAARWNLGLLDISIPVNVNLNSTCNAYFTPTNINFYRSGGGCSNTAYSSVISHEYGHFIVNQLGLVQGGFGEGFGDSNGMLIHNDAIVGRNFQGSGAVRTPDSVSLDYPCNGTEIHYCGQIVAGLWWDIRQNYGTTYGDLPGLELTRQLFVDWAQITNGGNPANSSLDSAYPATAVELLTVDDDNGDLTDGTPNYTIICNAFSQHAITCPAITPIGFAFPDGRPQFLNPGGTTPLRVQVIERGATATPNSLQMLYRVGTSGAFTTVAGSVISGNLYSVTFPQFPCGSPVNYYFTVGSSAGSFSSPSNAPTSAHVAVSAGGVNSILSDSFETNTGWTAGVAGDTATTGVWTRVDPVGTGAQPEDDHTGTPGTLCFVTGQGAVGGALGDNDVDGGTTTLRSPVYNLAANPQAVVGYWRWYSNSAGASPNADTFVVQVSNNGTSWVTAETVGPTGSEVNGGWIYHEFRVADFVAPNATVRVQFIASDVGSGSIIEAAIDDFSISEYTCDALPTPCPPDLDGNRVVDLTDLSILLSRFGLTQGATPSQGDLNGDGAINLTDLSIMLTAFGTPCAP